MPKISILIATRDRAHLIGRAIESVLKQTFTDWEIIVADDASTDNTREIIDKLAMTNSKIKYLNSNTNVGIARISNKALREAKGEYIAILDDDDYWSDSDKLKKQVEFLEKNQEYIGVGGGVIVVDKNNKELFRYLKPETDDQIRKKMLFDNPMANSATLFRRSVAEKVGLYDESLRYSADRDFWLKIGLIGKLYNFPEYFTYYLMAGQNTSIVKMRDHLNSSLRAMRRYKNQYPYYRLALIFNRTQYAYAFLPNWIKKLLHLTLAKIKRLVFN